MAILTNIWKVVNKTTGNEETVRQVTQYADGTAMSDDKIGALYGKDLQEMLPGGFPNPNFQKYFKIEIPGKIGLQRASITDMAGLQKLINDTANEKRGILIDASINITDNLTIPKRCNVEIFEGCLFNVSAGKTLTIQGKVSSGRYQIFGGSGNVILGYKFCWLEWFGGIPDTMVDCYNAIIKARSAMAATGGVIRLGDGRYNLPTAIDKFPNNIHVKGNGSANTQFINVSSFSVSEPGVGDDYDKNDPVAFKNTTRRGDMFVDLKDPADADKFKSGDIFAIRGGAHYYDQDYMEQNKVLRVDPAAGRVWLRDPLGRNYNTQYINYYGVTNLGFTMPAIGANITITGTNMPNGSSANGRIFSIGDNLFKLISGTSTSSVFQNVGKGNDPEGSVIATGGLVAKGRICWVPPRTQNFRLTGVKIQSASTGTIRLFRLDGSYGSEIENVEIEVHPDILPTANVAIWFTDNAHSYNFRNVKFTSPYVFSTQISRSSSRGRYLNCEFTNAKIDASEYAFDQKFKSCVMKGYFEGVGYMLGFGDSCSGIIAENCEIHCNASPLATTKVSLMYNLEIQGQTTADVDYNGLKNCEIRCNNVHSIAYDNPRGNVIFNGNKIYGRVNIIGSISSSTQAGRGAEFKNNTFKLTKVSYTSTNFEPFIGIAGNVDAVNNIFEFVGDSDFVPAEQAGNFLRFYDGAALRNIIFKNNTFKGFPLSGGYYRFDSPFVVTSNMDIANNRFQSNIPVSANIATDFTLTLRDNQTGQYGDEKLYAPKAKNADLDYQLWLDLVRDNGGITSDLEKSVAYDIIRKCYRNGIREKLRYLTFCIGDFSASLVPLFGSDLALNGRNDARTKRSASLAGGMTDANYNTLTGWRGDGASKRIRVLAKPDIDVTNATLFLQIAAADTTANPRCYLGTDNNFSIYVTSTGTTLRGIAQRDIKAGIARGVGFIASARSALLARQLGITDVGGGLITSVSGYSTSNTPVNSTDVTVNLVTHGGFSATSSDVSLKAWGVGLFMEEDEILMLRQIIREACITLGVPVPIMA